MSDLYSLPYYITTGFIGGSYRNNCYLCDKKLTELSTLDHIIPDSLFHTADPNRPQLKVHYECNNAKSMDDDWFVKHLQIRCGFDSEAEEKINIFMNKAISEKVDAYIIGKKPRHYILAHGLFDKVIWGLEMKFGDKEFKQMQIPKDDSRRFQNYVEKLSEGLFRFHVPTSNPKTPKLIMKQYADLALRHKQDTFMEPVNQLIQMSQLTKFGQKWGNHIMYVGSRVNETPDKGFIFIQFYSQFGILAYFD